jgi:hypothetical protein
VRIQLLGYQFVGDSLMCKAKDQLTRYYQRWQKGPMGPLAADRKWSVFKVPVCVISSKLGEA